MVIPVKVWINFMATPRIMGLNVARLLVEGKREDILLTRR
jgi:hypothetical protein